MPYSLNLSEKDEDGRVIFDCMQQSTTLPLMFLSSASQPAENKIKGYKKQEVG